MSLFFFIAGFGLVFNWWWMGAVGLLGVAVTMVLRSQERHDSHYIPAEEVQRSEAALGRF
jgi:cytochrome aa3-600 menaquinol oxidase subunit 1